MTVRSAKKDTCWRRRLAKNVTIKIVYNAINTSHDAPCVKTDIESLLPLAKNAEIRTAENALRNIRFVMNAKQALWSKMGNAVPLQSSFDYCQ